MGGYFNLLPDELERLKSMDLGKLVPIVESLDLQPGKIRPIRLILPPELIKALGKAADRGHKKKSVLICAARVYRRRHHLRSNRPGTEPLAENSQKEKRQGYVLRLEPEERQLLQNIGRGGPKDIRNRHEALIALSKIINEMKLPDIRRQRKSNCYLATPVELDVAIERRYRESKMKVPRVKILLKAAEHFS